MDAANNKGQPVDAGLAHNETANAGNIAPIEARATQQTLFDLTGEMPPPSPPCDGLRMSPEENDYLSLCRAALLACVKRRGSATLEQAMTDAGIVRPPSVRPLVHCYVPRDLLRSGALVIERVSRAVSARAHRGLVRVYRLGVGHD
jgi:hypothetical protein